MATSDTPRIGDFQRPMQPPTDVQAPEKPASPPPTSAAEGPAAERLASKEAELEERERLAKNESTPLVIYEEALKLVGLSREQAAKIFDDYLFEGFYSEPFDLPGDRGGGVFRTRLYSDTLRFYEFLENARPTYQVTIDEAKYRYLLAGSLSEYRDKKHNKRFSFPPVGTGKAALDLAFNERLDFILSLGDPLIRLLYGKLEKFDERIRIALKEGAVENF